MRLATFFGPSPGELGIIAIVGLLVLASIVLASLRVFVAVDQQSGKKSGQQPKEREFPE